MDPNIMKQCCDEGGKPDFEKMKQFMKGCGKQLFNDNETKMMKQFCGCEGMPDPEKMKELMKKCGCHVT